MAKLNLDQFYNAGDEDQPDLDSNLDENLDGNELSNFDDNIEDNIDGNIDNANTDEQPTLADMLKMDDNQLKEMGIDDPKAWKSYQKKLVRQKNDFDRERSSHAKEITELKGAVDTLMKMMQNTNQPPAQPKAEELVKPLPPKEPLRPSDFNLNDAQTDANSASYRYMLDSEKYDKDFKQYMLDVSDYNAKITQRGFEELRESNKMITAEKQQQAAQAKFLSDFQSAGATYEEAIGLWNDYIITKQGFEPKNMLALYRAQKGTGRNNQRNNQFNANDFRNRSQNFDKRRNIVNNNPPPGVGRGNPKQDDSQSFMSGIGKGSAKIDNLYSTVSKK